MKVFYNKTKLFTLKFFNIKMIESQQIQDLT